MLTLLGLQSYLCENVVNNRSRKEQRHNFVPIPNCLNNNYRRRKTKAMPTIPMSDDKNTDTVTTPCPATNGAVLSLEDKFKAAVKVIHSLPKDGPYQPSNSTKLKFYGLFKQATEGPCSTPKPGFWD